MRQQLQQVTENHKSAMNRLENPEGGLKDSSEAEGIWKALRALWCPQLKGSLQKATTWWKISSLLSQGIYSYTNHLYKLPRILSTGELLPPELIVALYPAHTNVRNPFPIRNPRCMGGMGCSGSRRRRRRRDLPPGVKNFVWNRFRVEVPFANERSIGINTEGYTIDIYTIVSKSDLTLVVTAIDKSDENLRDREVRLLVEVKDFILGAQSSANQ